MEYEYSRGMETMMSPHLEETRELREQFEERRQRRAAALLKNPKLAKIMKRPPKKAGQGHSSRSKKVA